MDLDVTLFAQLALLAVLMVVMNGLLFAPMLAVIEKRHQKISGTRSEVDRLERLAAADRAAYETRLRASRREAAHLREALRIEGRDGGRRIITEARATIGSAMVETRAKVQASERAAAQALQADVSGIAGQLVDRLLGRRAAS